MRSLILILLATAATAWAAPSNYDQLRLDEGTTPLSPGDTLQATGDVKDGLDLGWLDPRLNGGSMLDFTTLRKGEPLNVIISAKSDPFILTDPGLRAYAKSIGFSEECLGLHVGKRHLANLGDGHGRKVEHFLARQDYFPVWGTCWESFAGGNHFRAWKQNGSLANSGAWFLGVSKEENSGRNHKIVKDGYNIGRDWLVDKATKGSHWNGLWWSATVEWNEGLLQPGRRGVNHGIPQDGRVAILTVQSQTAISDLYPKNFIMCWKDAGKYKLPYMSGCYSFNDMVEQLFYSTIDRILFILNPWI